MAGTRLLWLGPKVLLDVMQATKAAIDETTDHAAKDASANHWWGERRGNLQSQVVNEPARPVGKLRLKGKFGTTADAGFYGLFLELRTPFLRPAADRHFRMLAHNIRRRL
jgi:hypothetical protein